MAKTSWIEIRVSNFEESLGWFKHVLGFDVTARPAEAYAELSRGEVSLHIAADHPSPQTSDQPDLPPPGQRGGGVEIVLLVENVETLYHQAQRAAADIVRPLAEHPWHMRQFCVRHPDGYLLRLAQKVLSINLATYRQQITDAFQCTLPLIVQGLEAIKLSAATLLEQQDSLGAATIYETLITEIFAESHLFYEEDEDDDFYEEEVYYPEEEGLEEFVVACMEALGVILISEQADQMVREKCIKVLFDVYLQDLHADNRHGFDTHAAEQLIATTTPLERHTLAVRIRTLLGEEEEKRVLTAARRQTYGKFWLALEQEVLDDEAYLRICRQTGCISDLVDRLLALGRIDEATREARQVTDSTLLSLADLFIQHGQETVIEQLVQTRAQEKPGRVLLEWLQRYYRERHNPGAELEVAIALFRVQPFLQRYRELRTLADQFNRWEALRSQMLDHLAQASNTVLLIEIALDEDDIDRALQLLQGMEKKGSPGSGYAYIAGYGYYGFSAIALQVARAAEQTRPLAAVELYQQLAEDLIAQRGRQNYQEACKHLARIQALYKQIDEATAWTRYIAALRERNRSLRALKEELAQAGL